MTFITNLYEEKIEETSEQEDWEESTQSTD
jgi:hypothetical protein